MSDLQLHLLWWPLSFHMVLEWQPSYLEQECYLEGYIFRILMPTCIIHDEQKLNSARGRASAELCTQPGSCGWGWMAAQAGNVAAELPAAASHQGCRQRFSAHGCEHPLPADFGGGGKLLCASLLAATSLLLLSCKGCSCQCCHSPKVFNRFAFCSLFSPHLVGFNLIASFSDRLSQEQCKWALKCGDLVYICQLIAWVAQTSRAGTCLLVLRYIFDFRPNAACRGWAPDRGGCALCWAGFVLCCKHSKEAVAQCKAAWICSLLGELTQASPSEAPASLPTCLALLCDPKHL